MLRSDIDLDNALSNSFTMSIDLFPNINYKCINMELPSIDFSIIELMRYGKEIPKNGDTVTFGELPITFIVDKNFLNYKLLLYWGLLASGKNSWVTNYNDTINKHIVGDNIDKSATIDLIVTNTDTSIIQSFRFYGCVLGSLSGLNYGKSNDPNTELTIDTTFKYMYFLPL